MIGWLANFLVITGVLALSHKKRWGFLLGATGSLIWSTRAILTDQWDLLGLQGTLVLVQLLGWIKWGKST